MALISNGTTIASGGTVSYNRLTDTPTIPTNTNQLTNGAGFITSAPAPTNSQVLSGVASASAGAVGSYSFLNWDNGSNTNQGGTASSALYYANAAGTLGQQPSGTWRQMGYRTSDTNEKRSTVWLRIS